MPQSVTHAPFGREMAPALRTPDVLPQDQRETLDRLRLMAARQRAKARVDLFHACALLDRDPVVAADAFGEALFRTLPQALDRSPRLFRPGCHDLSFDEGWLLSLLDTTRTGDVASREFLLRSRVRPEARRSIAYLAKNLAERLDRT